MTRTDADSKSATTLALHLAILVAVSGYFESLFVHQSINLLGEGSSA